MDAWWESLDRAFAAWTQAIDESELTWKYRQVENGEWNVMSGQASGLDAPLPWDHLDTGIDKAWLKADLQRALEAATVPDCSFEGCSHCGVCGADFGHNVVVPPQEIPPFAGQFVPNQTRAQRMRVWMGKLGDLALISHLDSLRLFDRAIRRAALPIAFTGGFHPSPRIAPASALPLGVTSSGEIVDFDLTQSISIEEFQQKLAAQLPAEMPIYRVESIAPNSDSATHLLEQAEYWITVSVLSDAGAWQTWIDQVLAVPELWMEQTTKSGKTRQVNLRDRLFELQLLETGSAYLPQRLQPELAGDLAIGTTATLRFVGSCQNDGTLLRPEHIIYMLQQTTQQEFQLQHIHRAQLFLKQC